MTEIVISIQPSPTQASSGYRQTAPSGTATFAPLPPPTWDNRPLPSPPKDLFLPPMAGVTLEMPPPKQLAEASYQAQLPRLTYTATYDTPSTRRQPDRRIVASAARVYARQLNMVAFKVGLLVDCYA